MSCVYWRHISADWYDCKLFKTAYLLHASFKLCIFHINTLTLPTILYQSPWRAVIKLYLVNLQQTNVPLYTFRPSIPTKISTTQAVSTNGFIPPERMVRGLTKFLAGCIWTKFTIIQKDLKTSYCSKFNGNAKTNGESSTLVLIQRVK